MQKKFVKFMGKYGLALAFAGLMILIAVSFFSLSWSGAYRQEKMKIDNQKEALAPQIGFSAKVLPGNVPKLSKMKGPSIDGEGVFDVRESRCSRCACEKRVACSALPAGTWILFLAVYLFLLVFNLGFTFGKRKTVQWGWEAGLTVLALAVWFWLDNCQVFVWYPLFVIGLGVLIYIFYLFFFSQHLLTNVEDDKMA